MEKKFCQPYIQYIFEYIMEKTKTNECLIINESEYKKIEELIQAEIFRRCFKSLLYCMNAERSKGNLIGNTSEKRYLHFSETKYCIEAMEKYFPALKIQLYKEIKGKSKFVFDVVNSFKENEKSICKYFFGTESEVIYNIKNGGDWHNDKCVVIILFKSGNKIVYKPTKGRNLEFLKGMTKYFFCSEYEEQYSYLYDKKGTWMKFVEHIKIFDKKEIQKFYYNYGKVLFIAYLLGINDIHYENLIAHGEYPVITDVETIFSSYLFLDTHQFQYDAQYKASKKLLYGVMATGMIPIFSMTEYFGGDVSCLSNKGLKVNVEKVNNIFRDDMYIYAEPTIVMGYDHLPNEQIDPLLYKKQIELGFEEAVNIFRNKEEKIVCYILDNFEKVETRIILNMTKAYSRIVKMKSDPRYRYDSKLFNRLLENLKIGNQFNELVYEYEVGELRRGNIPSFYWSMELNCVYGRWYDETKKIIDLKSFSKSKLRGILKYQTEQNMLLEQKRIICDSIASNIALGIEYRGLKTTEKIISSNGKEFLKENIDNRRIEGIDGTISWIGLIVNDKEQLEYAALDWSLYSGLTGVGYMYISGCKNNKLSIRIVNRIYYTMTKACDMGIFNKYDISYFCGLTGIYAFFKEIRNERIVNPTDVDIYIEKIRHLMKSNLSKTNVYDTLSGIHSAVIYFFGCYKTDSFARTFLPEISKYFLTVFNMNTMNRDFNYASFAHGYAGIMTSIMCMNRVISNEVFMDIIQTLWKYENDLYMGDFMWKDSRSTEGEHSHFWCHGSCGIMFSRLIWKKYGFLKEKVIDITDMELDECLGNYKRQIISQNLNTQNYSLCHGNFALIDYLLAYETLYGKSEEENEYIIRTIENGKEQGYSCVGAPGAINSIGFMVGESGIQYTLDRYKNNKLHSILAIETL